MFTKLAFYFFMAIAIFMVIASIILYATHQVDTTMAIISSLIGVFIALIGLLIKKSSKIKSQVISEKKQLIAFILFIIIFLAIYFIKNKPF